MSLVLYCSKYFKTGGRLMIRLMREEEIPVCVELIRRSFFAS